MRLLPIALLLCGAARAADTENAPDLGGRRMIDFADDAAALPAWPALTPHFDATLATARRCDETAGQLPWIGEDDRAAARRAEAARIAASGGVVSRKHDRLTLAPPEGAPLAFVDWKNPGTRTAEGDERYYYYAGRMPGSGLWRVEVHFGHDAPASYLVAPAGNMVAYAHHAGRITAVSVDGHWLANFESLNAPYRLAIAALAADGARSTLECRFEPRTHEVRASSCGWIAPATFELAWGDAPLRFVRQGDAWTLTVGAASAPLGIRCVAL